MSGLNVIREVCFGSHVMFVHLNDKSEQIYPKSKWKSKIFLNVLVQPKKRNKSRKEPYIYFLHYIVNLNRTQVQNVYF